MVCAVLYHVFHVLLAVGFSVHFASGEVNPHFEGAVVYIHRSRSLPVYTHLTVELAARTNHVVIISEVAGLRPDWENVTYVSIKQHLGEALRFEKLYVHMALDQSEGRKSYELSCFQRWFILYDFMTKYGLKRVFYGDSDTVVFASMREAFNARSTCDAVVSVETQKNSASKRV